MRKYRKRVTVRSAMWQTDNFRTEDAWAQRHQRLAAADSHEKMKRHVR